MGRSPYGATILIANRLPKRSLLNKALATK
jgi:hypothetical protein